MERRHRRRIIITKASVICYFLLFAFLSFTSTTNLASASESSADGNDDENSAALETLVKILLGDGGDEKDNDDDSSSSVLELNPAFVKKDDEAQAEIETKKEHKNKKNKKKKKNVGDSTTTKSHRNKKSSKTTKLGDNNEEEVEESGEEEEEEEVLTKKEKKKKKKKEGKSVINKALSKTRETSSKTVKLLKKHRAALTVAAITFAFRREIALLLSKILHKTTGRDGRRGISINPTSILKILIILDVMRKLQNSSSGGGSGAGAGGDGSGESAALFALLGPGGGFLTHALSRFFEPGNPTYVPPIEQHYTFERVNERYEKDRMAFKKAMPRATVTGGGGQRGEKSSLSLSSSVLRDAMSPKKERRRFGGLRASLGSSSPPDILVGKNTTVVQEALGKLLASKDFGGQSGGSDYNGTVIILDMQNLDTSVSSMSVLRDQVSFLLTHIRESEKEKRLLNNVFAALDEVNKKNNNDAPENDEDKNQISSLSETKDTNVTCDDNAQNGTASLVPSSDTDKNKTPSDKKNGQIEVILLLESPGGSASDYGLAASQIGRLRDEPNVSVTICVDKVAASGGYMMACMSSPGRLYAAPFAVLGSIGVIGTAINVHNVLQKWGVRPLVFRGGKDKAPVGAIGEVTREGMAKVQDMIDKTHEAFKRHVVKARPVMKPYMTKVTTGDVWLGQDALDVGLIDRVVTSDEYIGERLREGARILKLAKYHRSKFPFLGSGHMSGYGAPLDFAHQAVKNRLPGGKIFSDLRRVVSKVADLLDELPETDSKDNLGSLGNAFQAYGMSATGAQAKSNNL